MKKLKTFNNIVKNLNAGVVVQESFKTPTASLINSKSYVVKGIELEMVSETNEIKMEMMVMFWFKIETKLLAV